MLVLGKTGAGKTTAINMIFNQVYNKKYEDNRIMAIDQKFTLGLLDRPSITEVVKNNIAEFKNRQSVFIGKD